MIFNLGDRKLFSSCGCGAGGCGTPSAKSDDVVDFDKVIKVLGVGCKKCTDFEAVVLDAVKQLGLDYEVAHITDLAVIAEYGVMSTPALVINEEVVSTGKVLSLDETKKLISEKIN